MNRILALLAFVIFVAFLAILGFGVPEPDLVAIIGLTILLVGYDLATSSGKKDDPDA